MEGSAIQITKENEKMASCFVSKLFGREISELYTDFLIFVLYKLSVADDTLKPLYTILNNVVVWRSFVKNIVANEIIN